MAASFGSISHATMRNEDLIPCFASELEYQVNKHAADWCSDQGRADRDKFLELANEANEIGEDGKPDYDSEDADEILSKLFDALGYFAPEYGYFGAHPGDGSDYGYWLDEEWQERAKEDDVLFVSDLSEVSDTYRGMLCVVNDHDNATLYHTKEGSGTLVEVWSVV